MTPLVTEAREKFRRIAQALQYDKSPSSPVYVALGEYLSATMDAWACYHIHDDDMIENTIDIEKFLTSKQIPD